MKQSAQIRRQHRSRQPLARDISDYKIESPSAITDQVAVVATHHASRLEVIGNIPPLDGKISGRQKAVLQLRCQLQVILECPLLRRGQTFQANTNQRIGKQTLIFDGALTMLAHSEGAYIDTLKRLVHLFQEMVQLRRLALAQHLLQSSTPLFQLLPNCADITSIRNRHD